MPTQESEYNPYNSPIWLNNQFLEKRLRKYFKDEKLKVVDFDARPATAKGENFASVLHRLTVTLNKAPGNHQSTELSIVAKETLCDELAFSILSSLNALDKETDFYDRIAPRIKEQLWKLNEMDSLIPETYGVCRARNVILFEDLLTKNYGTRKGFSIDDAKIVMKKLAAFHATSAKLQEETPHIFKNYCDGMISQTGEGFNGYYKTQIGVVIEVISKWPDFTKYVQKLERFRENLVEKIRKVFIVNPEHLNTLNHGDMWSSNIMVKNNQENQIENINFLDFQYSSWNSPAIDLNYLFNTSLQDPLEPKHLNELVECYHKNLVKYLENLNYKNHIPTLGEFKQQYFEKIIWGFTAKCLIQPIQINEYTEPVDIETIFSDNQNSRKIQRQMYSSPKIHANLRMYIPYYDKLGVFD